MDDDPFEEEECRKEQCANVRDNLKHMILASRKQAADLQSYSKLQASYEIVKHQLVATEALATSSTEKYNASVNAKEVAEAEVKQLQSTADYHRRKLIMLEEQAEKAEQHKQQAIEWREKYDELARFCNTLNSKNEEVKEKYEGAVKTLSAVAKQMTSSDGQLKSLKTANADLAGRQKKLDKYLKSAIKVIDALSNTANLSKHPKAIKDLVNVFRRDDVRLFFDTPPWKNSSGSEPIEESSDQPDNAQNAVPAVLNDSSTTSMSDDGEPVPLPNSSEFENIDFTLGLESESDSEEEMEKIEKSMKKVVRKAVKTSSPNKYLSGKQKKITSKTRELTGRASAARASNPMTGNREPTGLQRGKKSSYMFNATQGIAKVDDFATPSGAGPSGAPGASGAGATIHGRKGKTVREQQAEMMKESVKEKVARMKQQQEEKKSQKTVEKPRHCMSEGSDEGSDGEVAPKEKEQVEGPVEPRMTRARLRSFSTHSRKSISEAPNAQEQSMTTRSRPSSSRESRSDTFQRNSKKSPTPTRPMSRSERARARSALRGDDEEEDNQKTPQPTSTEKKEALKERVKETRKRAPAPAPLDSGPPTRSKTVMSVQAPKKKAQMEDFTSDEIPVLKTQEDVPSSSRLEAGFETDVVNSEVSVESSQEHSEVEKAIQEDVVPSEVRDPAPIPEAVITPEVPNFSSEASEPVQASAPVPDPEAVITPEIPNFSSEVSEPVKAPALEAVVTPEVPLSSERDVFSNDFYEELDISSPRYSPVVDEPEEMESTVSEAHQDSTLEVDTPSEPAPISTTSTGSSEVPAPSDVPDVPPKVIIPPEPIAKKTKNMLKSPNHEIICDLGLDISDSEGEDEEAVSPSAPKKPEEPKTPVKPAEPAEPYNPYHPNQADAQRIREPPPLTAVPKKSALRSTSKPPIPSKSTSPGPSSEVQRLEPTSSEVKSPISERAESEIIEPPSVKTLDPSKAATPSQTSTTDSEILTTPIPDSEPASENTKIVSEPVELPPMNLQKTSELTSSEPAKTLIEAKEVVSEKAIPTLAEKKSPEPTSSDVSEPVNTNKSEKKIPESVKTPESDSKPSVQQKPTSSSISESPDALSSEFEHPVKPRKERASSKATPRSVANSSKSKAPTVKKSPEAVTPSAPESAASTSDLSDSVPEKLQKSVVKAPESKERVFKRRGESKMKPSAPPAFKRISSAQLTPPASDDLLGDILSGAKMPVKKPMKRPATSSEPTSETAAPEPAKIQKPEPEPSTSSEPPAPKKFSAAKKPMVPIIEPVVKRARAKSVSKSAPEDGERRRGPRGKEKIANSLKAQLRQALDLKVGVHELKRLMEEKGIILGDSIALEAADAADVMIGFLRETSAGDMWAVLKRQRTEGNCAPLMNTEEQNFLQVSVSLNEHDQELLELFIGRILSELAVRDTLDSRQLGRLSRLFCHSVRFADRPPPEKYEWMRRFTLLLLLKHPAHLAKSIAFCLISDSAEHCQWLVEQLLEHPDSSFSTAFRCLLHVDPEVEGVVNWLLNSTFQLPRLTPPTPNDIQKAFHQASTRFLEIDSDEDVGEALKESIYLAKTGQHGCLQMVFDMLKKEMEQLDTQFIQPNEKEKELQHRTIYSMPTVPTKMTKEAAVELRRKFEWKKCVLSVITDNRHTDHWKAVMSALKQISSKIVTIRELLSSSSAEMFVEPDALEDVRSAIEHMVEFIAEFTNYPLKSTVLPKSTPTTAAPSSSNAQ